MNVLSIFLHFWSEISRLYTFWQAIWWPTAYTLTSIVLMSCLTGKASSEMNHSIWSIDYFKNILNQLFPYLFSYSKIYNWITLFAAIGRGAPRVQITGGFERSPSCLHWGIAADPSPCYFWRGVPRPCDRCYYLFPLPTADVPSQHSSTDLKTTDLKKVFFCLCRERFFEKNDPPSQCTYCVWLMSSRNIWKTLVFKRWCIKKGSDLTTNYPIQSSQNWLTRDIIASPGLMWLWLEPGMNSRASKPAYHRQLWCHL